MKNTAILGILAVLTVSLALAAPASAAIITSGQINPADPNTWTSSTDVFVANTAGGTVSVTGGSDVNSKNCYIGHTLGSIGAFALDGAGSTWTAAGNFVVGNIGNGKAYITNGGVVTAGGNGYIAYGGSTTGEATVDGANSRWNINGSTGFYIGFSTGTAKLNITDGGAVVVSKAVLVKNTSCSVNIEVSNNNMLQVGTGFNNYGTVRLWAQSGLVAGEYTPISAGTWGTAGTVTAFGGKWSSTAHTFAVAAAQNATAGQQASFDLFDSQRVNVGSTLAVDFQAPSSSTPITFTPTSTSGTTLAALQTALAGSDYQYLQGSWDYAVTGLPSGDVMLSYAINSNAGGLDDLKVWHYASGSWAGYSPTVFLLSGGWAYFTVDSLNGKSYAVSSSIPEPGALALLVLGGVGMLLRRRRA